MPPAYPIAPPEAGARVPKESLQEPGFVVLYLNQPSPEFPAPFGLTVPLSIAESTVILVAAFVVTVGNMGGSEATKESTEPNDIPPAFEAIAQ